jgi:hypothetical protein
MEIIVYENYFAKFKTVSKTKMMFLLIYSI